MAKRSLRWRLLTAMLVVFALGFGNLAIYLYGTRDALRRAVMTIEAQVIANGFSASSDPASLPSHYAGGELSYSLYAADAQLLWMSPNLKHPRRLKQPSDDGGGLYWSAFSGRVVSVPVRLADGAILMVAKQDTLEREVIGDLLAARLQHSLVLMVPIGLVSLVLILLLLHWSLRPVYAAAKQARGIGPARPSQRIFLAHLPSEIQPLADAANSALDRLAAAYTAEKRFVADAAHELRTPLTVLDLRLQAARRDGQMQWPALEAEMQQMRRLVTQLLELARQEGEASEGSAMEQQTNLSRVTREVCAALLPLFEARGRLLEVDIAEGCECRGNADQLREALANLLENALVHGQGCVQVALYRCGQALHLDVADQGVEIEAAEREAMFLRFRKGRQSTQGTGLGLAIVRQIVQNAGGRVAFVEAPTTTVRVALTPV
ncbi:HAMP domain-containing histidine kinase [Pseudomonas sp. JQ170]|uniref:sensor histidine kinase n=1 Tax=unclassified Pseudomonas TaxID=196821 RepID=UPI002651AFCF|nr:MULTISPECIES: HAMP domain-containing sensor histidine kinase [unclassified Pseudomonas]MDN7139285.1 HAMP domain-containing histidine kinase [Pseudomonas sp. JQ170]WRO77394.1 HAMP domain-containing sensor histidine kinase [Pseudomonas sp. 170C]